MKPLTLQEHHAAEMRDIDQQLDAHEREQRRADATIAEAYRKAGITQPLSFAQTQTRRVFFVDDPSSPLRVTFNGQPYSGPVDVIIEPPKSS